MSLIPGWVKLAILAALAVGAVIAWNGYTGSLVARGDKAGYTRAVNEYRARELAAVKAAREEERRKTAAVQKEIEDARKELAALRGSYDGAVGAGQRLRAQLAAAYTACRGPAQPAAPGRSAPTNAAEGVLAELLRRTHEAEERVAQYADESRIAGRACERSYDALTPPQ